MTEHSGSSDGDQRRPPRRQATSDHRSAAAAGRRRAVFLRWSRPPGTDRRQAPMTETVTVASRRRARRDGGYRRARRQLTGAPEGGEMQRGDDPARRPGGSRPRSPDGHRRGRSSRGDVTNPPPFLRQGLARQRDDTVRAHRPPWPSARAARSTLDSGANRVRSSPGKGSFASSATRARGRPPVHQPRGSRSTPRQRLRHRRRRHPSEVRLDRRGSCASADRHPSAACPTRRASRSTRRQPLRRRPDQQPHPVRLRDRPF